MVNVVTTKRSLALIVESDLLVEILDSDKHITMTARSIREWMQVLERGPGW